MDMLHIDMAKGGPPAPFNTNNITVILDSDRRVRRLPVIPLNDVTP